MTTITYTFAGVEYVGGRQRGTLMTEALSFKETLTGDRYGRPAPLVTVSHVVDVLTGQRTGVRTIQAYVTREVVSGARVGISIKPQFASTVIEVIGRDSSYKLETVTREVLLYAPNDVVTIAWQAATLRMRVAQRRATMRVPSTVWSANTVPVLREQVVQRNRRTRPVSTETALTLREMVAQKRAGTPPAEVLSPMRTYTLQELTVQSRSIKSTPVSGIVTFTERQQIAQRRVKPAPSTAFSTTRLAGEVMLVVQSKRAEYRLQNRQLFELIVQQRLVTFSAPTRAQQVVEEVAQRRVTPGILVSPITAISERQEIAQRRVTPGIVHSLINVLSEVAQVAQRRVADRPQSTTAVYQQRELVTMKRTPIRYYSALLVGQQVELVAMKRVPGPLPYTKEYAQQVRMLAVQHRDVLPPNKVGDWEVFEQVQQIVQHRTLGRQVNGMIVVAGEVIQYTLAAKYPNPHDVIGPEVGAQVKRLANLAVQHRRVDPPDTVVTKSRFVYQAAEAPVIRDRSFPDKNISYNQASAFSVVEQVALVDKGWPSKDMPHSDVTVDSVAEILAVREPGMPDPNMPLSDAMVSAMQQTVVMGDDAFVDPTIPLSDALVQQVAQFAAVGDAQFGDPTIPLSDVRSLNVGLLAAVRDPSLVGEIGQSEVSAFVVAAIPVIRDPSLVGIPLRRGPRPIVTVSMS